MNTKLIPAIAIATVAIITILIYVVMVRTQEQTNSKKGTTILEDQTEITKDTSKESAPVLVNATSPFYEFQQAHYEKAIEEGKVIILDFYANWCPVCRGEAPMLEQGFRQLEEPNVIGFRVNYNDSDTDEDEKALAEKYGVTYQHTKVILKDGQQVLKDGEVWDTETFLEKVRSVL